MGDYLLFDLDFLVVLLVVVIVWMYFGVVVGVQGFGVGQLYVVEEIVVGCCQLVFGGELLQCWDVGGQYQGCDQQYYYEFNE